MMGGNNDHRTASDIMGVFDGIHFGRGDWNSKAVLYEFHPKSSSQRDFYLLAQYGYDDCDENLRILR